MAAPRTSLITGVTHGIGLWTALGLAERGGTVAIVARDPARGETSRRWLAERAPEAAIDLLVADLASMAAVRGLAAEVLARYPRLDLLVNNAGLARDRRQPTADGFETMFAVNCLAPFVLTRALLDRMKASAPARIVNVGSASSDRARIDLGNLQAEKSFSMMGKYGQSKLAMMLWTFELARRLDGTGVTANIVHPGVVATNIGNVGGWKSLAFSALKPFLLSEEQGAETTLHVALAPELATVTGRYFKKKAEAKTNPVAQDRALAAKLWDELERLAP
ncbi:MAG TPA: SDR family oxidoreductase [Aliidongia sp.]|nr:SDR family oxidoreductase [Aliidongia sp.]